MASFRKRGKTWSATIDRVGLRPEHATFRTKAQAEGWARQRETELLADKRGQILPHTVREALQRYARDVAPAHKGERWERVRLLKFERVLPFIDRGLSEVHASDVAAWRDASLKRLAPASVRREMVLLRLVFEAARKEWGWLAVNPMLEIGWPSAGRARDRRVSNDEISAILAKLGYRRGASADTISQRVALAFLWAVETAMRAGEIVGLTWDRVSVEGRFASLPKTKNGDGRKVPLSKAAIEMLSFVPNQSTSVFGLTSGSLDTLFRKARDEAGINGLHFHDSRAEALTRMSKKVDVLTLARIAGHRDLKSLAVYYRESATEIAARLD